MLSAEISLSMKQIVIELKCFLIFEYINGVNLRIPTRLVVRFNCFALRLKTFICRLTSYTKQELAVI